MKPNHSNSDIYGDIDSWSLKEAPERLKVNSDNLKEQISEILDLVEVGVGGVTRLKGDEWVDGISVDKATDQLLQLFQDYCKGCVPEEKVLNITQDTACSACAYDKEYRNKPCPYGCTRRMDITKFEKENGIKALDIEGYNQCRQDMLDKINCYRTDTLSYNQARQDYLDNLDNLEGKS